jgi:hypothetical protein
MKKSTPVKSASASIDAKIEELGAWRGSTLAKARDIIHEADPEIVEEWKWAKANSPGTPVFSYGGIVCTGETYKTVVKLTICQRRFVERPFAFVQLQPRWQRPARYRHPRRRENQRGGLEGSHSRCGSAQSQEPA